MADSSRLTTTSPRARWCWLRTAALTLAALVLYALLIDTAFETWQALSPVRIWVTLPIAVFVSFTVWMVGQHSSHRPSINAAIWLSMFLLLTLLAVTASLPGGMTDGMMVVGLPTTTVLTGASLAVLLLAFFSLVFSGMLPMSGRLVAGLAAAYGVAALGMGLAQGRSYVQLMQGASLWQRLPYWSRGAFVGGLIVLPAAFLLELALALKVLKVRGRLHRMVAFALGIAIAYAAFTYVP